MIRVGRCLYDSKGQVSYPSFEGFTEIIVMMRGHSKYSSLSPYYLKNEKGEIMENIWQFSKLYEVVPKTTQRFSRWNNKIIWEHPREIHYNTEVRDAKGNPEEGQITDAYWAWRKKGFQTPDAIRYPVGFKARHNCLCALADEDLDTPLDYIDSRKRIYVPTYIEMAKKTELFSELSRRLYEDKENLLIIEVDGPHQESLSYYQETYPDVGISDDFIQDHTMLATHQNLEIMLNDPKHPFGHGYCLAMALLNQ
jgi:hypothetical protein